MLCSRSWLHCGGVSKQTSVLGMRKLALLLVLSPMVSFGMDRMSALSMIETGNNDRMVAKDNEDLSAFEKLPPLRAELDPLNIRAAKQVLNSNDIDGVYGLARFFTEADLKTLGEHHGNSLVKLLAKVRALPAEVFAAKPFSRVAMMQALTGKSLEYCCIKTEEMSPPVASGVPPLAIKAHPELQPFAEYCFACHRGNPAKRLNFMAGDTEQAVLDNIKKKTEIRDALDWERYANPTRQQN